MRQLNKNGLMLSCLFIRNATTGQIQGSVELSPSFLNPGSTFLKKFFRVIFSWLDLTQLEQGLARLDSKQFLLEFGSTQLSSRGFWLDTAQLEPSLVPTIYSTLKKQQILKKMEVIVFKDIIYVYYVCPGNEICTISL